MARRNKKKNVNGFMFPAPFAGVAVLFSLLAVGYIWLCCRCESLGTELKALEKEKENLNKRYLSEELKWMRMKSLGNVEKALLRNNTIMTWSRRDQIVRIYESAADGSVPIRMAENTIKYETHKRIVMNE